jgi:hypothetical protein
MLMHVSLTVSLLTLNPLALAGANLSAFSFALAAVLWVAVAIVFGADRPVSRSQPRHRAELAEEAPLLEYGSHSG